jgi:phage gp36-like protein
VETALRDASEVVESYLRERYAVPLSSTPESLRQHVCAMARYALAHGEDREPTEQMRRAHDGAMKWLADLAAGRATLPLAPAVAQPGIGSGGARVAVRPGELSADQAGPWT